MNILWRNPDKVANDQLTRMDKVWGDRSWREAAYRKERGLFGEMEEKTDNEAIAEAFRMRLKKVAGFKYVPEPMPCVMKGVQWFTISSLLLQTKPALTLWSTSLKSTEKEESGNGTKILHRMD